MSQLEEARFRIHIDLPNGYGDGPTRGGGAPEQPAQAGFLAFDCTHKGHVLLGTDEGTRSVVLGHAGYGKYRIGPEDPSVGRAALLPSYYSASGWYAGWVHTMVRRYDEEGGIIEEYSRFLGLNCCYAATPPEWYGRVGANENHGKWLYWNGAQWIFYDYEGGVWSQEGFYQGPADPLDPEGLYPHRDKPDEWKTRVGWLGRWTFWPVW